MEKQVVVHCHDCWNWNKHNCPGKDPKVTEFESFSEAWTHMFETMKEGNPHYMSLKYNEYEEQD